MKMSDKGGEGGGGEKWPKNVTYFMDCPQIPKLINDENKHCLFVNSNDGGSGQ